MEENNIATKEPKPKSKKALIITVLCLLLVIVILIAVLAYKQKTEKKSAPPQIIVTTELKEIIQLSELDTFHGIYNGIARKYNAKKPEEIDYYVSYESEVVSSIDFNNIDVSKEENEDGNIIIITLPSPILQEPIVAIETMDYIFENKKANTPTVSQEAYQLCLEDAKEKCKNEKEIYDLAKENAENTIHALVDPLVEQAYDGYTVTICWEE